MRLRFKSRKVLNKSEHLKRRTKTLMIMTMIWNGHSMSILCRSNEDACLLISWKSSWAHGKCWRLTLQTACLGREGGSRRESSQCRGRGPGWGPRLVSSSCLVRREGGSRWCWGCTCHCGPCSRPPRQQSPATSGKSSVPACQAIWNTETQSVRLLAPSQLQTCAPARPGTWWPCWGSSWGCQWSSPGQKPPHWSASCGSVGFRELSCNKKGLGLSLVNCRKNLQSSVDLNYGL